MRPRKDGRSKTTSYRDRATAHEGDGSVWAAYGRGRPDGPPGTLVVVSNRQPYRHAFADEPSSTRSTDGGDERTGPPIEVDEPTGGLTAGLDPILQRTNGTWIAWGDGDADQVVTDGDDCVRVPPTDETYTLRRLWLSESALAGYYYGYSNRVLWPLAHDCLDRIDHREGDFEWYRRVNGRFADAVVDHVGSDHVLWLQDYHLALAPRLIRDRLRADVPIAHFWHIPWPSPSTFERSPHGEAILDGLLGTDVLGFHVDRYATRFLDTVDNLLPGATVNRSSRRVEYAGTRTQVTATPMGVDAASHHERAAGVDRSEWETVRDRYGIPDDVVVGLGVDRLDYVKGIPQRLAAIERFFETNPDWRESFTFFQKATPSRTSIPAYERHRDRVRSMAERINDRFGTDDWTPIVYTESYLEPRKLATVYRYADFLAVTSIADGMNLVAEEFVASRVDGNGALVLSERTGAHEHLGDDAYTIDPDSVDSIVSTIERVLNAPRGDRRRRMRTLREAVFDHDLEWWMHRQFEAMHRVTATIPRVQTAFGHNQV